MGPAVQQVKVAEEDCLACKIIGTSAFSGISLYAYSLRAVTPKSDRGNRIFFGCFAVAAASIAIHRGFSDFLPDFFNP